MSPRAQPQADSFLRGHPGSEHGLGGVYDKSGSVLNAVGT